MHFNSWQPTLCLSTWIVGHASHSFNMVECGLNLLAFCLCPGAVSSPFPHVPRSMLEKALHSEFLKQKYFGVDFVWEMRHVILPFWRFTVNISSGD